MKKKLLWALYWLFVAFAIFAGLDNLIFQPPMPGWIIGTVALVSVAFFLWQTKRVMKYFQG